MRKCKDAVKMLTETTHSGERVFEQNGSLRPLQGAPEGRSRV